MMTSPRLRDAGESLASRRGHASQLSISDPSHHVTEAIGTLYGDSDDDSNLEPRRDSRPLSFIAAPYGGEQIQKLPLPQLSSQPQSPPRLGDRNPTDERRRLSWTTPDTLSSPSPVTVTNGNGDTEKDQTLPPRTPSHNKVLPYERPPQIQPMSPLSPTLHDVQPDSQGAPGFPITNIDNPNDIAQELSNLQALRRMSMDVGNTADPDLVPFQGLALMAMPSIAPTGVDDEGDISRLLWVPAKVHPELAPDQFKNFLENRVQSMKRRSTESSLMVDGIQRNSSDSLRRKKSMLSRQIESGSGDLASDGYRQDNNTILGRQPEGKRSQTEAAHAAPELSLNELVKDPSKVVQKLTMDAQRQIDSALEKSSLEDDRPILPVPTMGLRRSTRTTYRKGGSLRSGDRLLSRRTAARHVDGSEKEAEETALASLYSELPSHTQQPIHSGSVTAENVAVPERSARRQHPVSKTIGEASTLTSDNPVTESFGEALSFHNAPVTVPLGTQSSDIPPAATTIESTSKQPSRPFPQRSSSQKTSSLNLIHSKIAPHKHLDEQQERAPSRSKNRSSFGRTAQQSSTDLSTASVKASSNSTPALDDMTQHPPALPGGFSTRTDNLTFIPTLSTDERKPDKKAKDREDGDTGKSTGWKWFKSDDREKKKKDKDKDKDREREKDKEKEKEREREKDDQAKKSRGRVLGERTPADRGHDGARLDVLQSSIDNASQKGRDSLLLDRDSVDNKIHEEKKKEGSRKSSETKKEKDGFFGSIFGGSRRKESKESGNNNSKGKQRPLSPEHPVLPLRPDIDYPYTRFPIVQERAIYRMAHIKLANPRRDLRSQVVISNLMYDYLSKVQAMHPQLNVPTSPQQKRQDEERKRREQEQQQQQYLEQQLLEQQQHSQSNVDQYSFEYHRTGTQYGDAQPGNEDTGADYIDDTQIFEYANGDHHNDDSSPSHSTQQQQAHHEGYNEVGRSNGQRGYYDYEHSDESKRNKDDMW